MHHLICVIGVDGSGKSSQIDALVGILAARGLRVERHWCRWNPRLMRGIQLGLRFVLGRRARRDSASSSAPSSSADYAAWKQTKRRLFGRPLLRRMWIWGMLADYWWQALVEIMLPLRRCDVVLADRYLPDVAVDQAIHFPDVAGGLATILRHPLTALYPKPSLVLLIRVSPETAFARKSDIPCVEFVADRDAAYRALGGIIPVEVIDGEQSFDGVTADVCGALEKHLKMELRAQESP